MENVYILVQTSLQFVAEGPIDSRLSLVQVMGWRLYGTKPSFEPMLWFWYEIHVRISGSHGLGELSINMVLLCFALLLFLHQQFLVIHVITLVLFLVDLVTWE